MSFGRPADSLEWNVLQAGHRHRDAELVHDDLVADKVLVARRPVGDQRHVERPVRSDQGHRDHGAEETLIEVDIDTVLGSRWSQPGPQVAERRREAGEVLSIA